MRLPKLSWTICFVVVSFLLVTSIAAKVSIPVKSAKIGDQRDWDLSSTSTSFPSTLYYTTPNQQFIGNYEVINNSDDDFFINIYADPSTNVVGGSGFGPGMCQAGNPGDVHVCKLSLVLTTNSASSYKFTVHVGNSRVFNSYTFNGAVLPVTPPPITAAGFSVIPSPHDMVIGDNPQILDYSVSNTGTANIQSLSFDGFTGSITRDSNVANNCSSGLGVGATCNVRLVVNPTILDIPKIQQNLNVHYANQTAPLSQLIQIAVKNKQGVVGSLKGDFSVTPTGQAHYSIPIDAPPGTAKMQPMLAITYDSSSSNTRNGILGAGFSLDGLTAITRCPSSIAQNGAIHAVDYSPQDLYCLNGDQLVAIRGNYGADGTEYRTYNDSHAKIMSYGAQGNGPAYFKIWTKGGQIAEYGNTADSQIYATGKPTVATWALNKISDTVGNYLKVSYSQNNGAYYPAEIDYTGNDAASLAPYNSVKFNYQARPDNITSYQAGSINQITQRLANIQVYSGTQTVSSYNINYEQSSNTYHSRITSIQKCGADGVCLNPTTFNWQTNNKGWVEHAEYNLPADPSGIGYFVNKGADMGARILDNLRGDGLPGIVQSTEGPGRSSSIRKAWVDTGSGWADSQGYYLPVNITSFSDAMGYFDNGVRIVNNLNGNGLPGIIQSTFINHLQNDQDFSASSWINTGFGWAETPSYHLPVAITALDENDEGSILNARDNGVRVLDNLRGDGLPGVVWSVFSSAAGVPLQHDSWANTGSGWADAPGYYLPIGIVAFSNGFSHGISTIDRGVRFLNLGSNGLPGIVQSTSVTPPAQLAWTNASSGWTTSYALPTNITSGQYGTDLGVITLDLYGDGLDDAIKSTTSNGQTILEAWVNTGAGWVDHQEWHMPSIVSIDGKDNGVRVFNVTGSGLPDIIQSVGGTQQAWINTGNNWIEDPAYHAVPGGFVDTNGSDLGVRMADLTGSGFTDIIQSVIPVSGAPIQHVWFNAAQKYPDYLIGVTDGLGTTLGVEYRPLSGAGANVYTNDRGTGSAVKYPDNDWQGPMYVVYQTTSTASPNDARAVKRMLAKSNSLNHTTTYHYTGAKFNNIGWGFLGFRQVTATDESGISKVTNYSQDYNAHTVGKENSTQTYLGSTLIASTQNTWDTKSYGSYFMTYTKNVVNQTFDINSGALINTKTTNTTVDDYGNPTQIISTVQDSTGTYTTTTASAFSNDSNSWLVGELTGTKVSVATPNKNSNARSSTFTYDSNGLLAGSIVEPGDPNFQLTTAYTRDSFGNVIKTAVSGNGIEDRVNNVTYDSYGRFVVSTSTLLPHSVGAITSLTTSQICDPRFGVVTQSTDTNGVSVNNIYDGFGRLIETDNPDGSKATVSYAWVTNGPNNSAYSMTTQISGGATKVQYYDALGRQVAESKQNFDGTLIWNLTYYDELGRITQQSLPYFDGATPQYVQYQYDALGRRTKETKPDNTGVSFAYNGLSVTTTNALNQSTTKTYDSYNNLIETIDNAGSHTHYTYDSYGHMLTLTDSKGNVTSMVYDAYGRKTSMTDPDRGNWTYTYDVLGQLATQTDAVGNNSSFQYDKLGRMTSRTDAAGTSTWTYDTATNGIGKIATVTGLAGNGNKVPDITAVHRARKNGLESYSKTFTYDSLGRPNQTSMVINGNTYTSSITYDGNSRPLVETYPDGVQVKNIYNNLGFLVQITDNSQAPATPKLYWQLKLTDASGHVLQETHSNHLVTTYTYDSLGEAITEIDTAPDTILQVQKRLFPNSTTLTAKHQHLKTPIKANDNDIQSIHYDYDAIHNVAGRTDAVNAKSETFAYDNLNRLTQDQVAGGTSETYQYDELGNITFKSGVGTYKYGEHGYGGPHAVTTVTNNGVDYHFMYNKNGDQVSSNYGDVDRGITYTSFSKPLMITTHNASASFYYDADRDSFERDDQYDGKTVTTFYLGDYELDTTNDGKTITTQKKHYIGPNTIYTTSFDGTTTTTNTYETLHDKLGSVTDITDESGNVLQHFAYTPFGEQTITKTDAPEYPRTHIGFTGHEEIESMNLIHMNGRLYDPVLGRFLSADPNVQAPENSQSLNRYSYCVNNPLRYTDPSGYGFWDDICNFFSGIFDAIADAFKAIGRCVKDLLQNQFVVMGLEILAAALTNGVSLVVQAASVAGVAGASVLAAGGNFNQALLAAGFAALSVCAWGGVGDYMADQGLKAGDTWASNFGCKAESTLLHGVVGGGLNSLEGGSFKDGFLSGAVGEACSGFVSNAKCDGNAAATFMERAGASAVIGGTAAALGGGSFADGAETAAFAEMFNDLAHDTLTVDEGQQIADTASNWKDTPYAFADDPNSGEYANMGVGADCSGSTHAAYWTTGYEYPYMSAGEFADTSGGGYFEEVSNPQVGDVVSWSGHMGIYAGENASGQDMMWTTHTFGNNGNYGLDKVQSFTNNFGQDPRYYRYKE